MKKTILCAALALGISLLGINAFSENISGKDSMFGNGIKCQQITGCAKTHGSVGNNPPTGTLDTSACDGKDAYTTASAKDMNATLSSNSNCTGRIKKWNGLQWFDHSGCGQYNTCTDWYEPEA